LPAAAADVVLLGVQLVQRQRTEVVAMPNECDCCLLLPLLALLLLALLIFVSLVIGIDIVRTVDTYLD
jgi:hypothetical protein